MHAHANVFLSDAMTKHMAVEFGADSVRVVGIAPGPISDTEGVRRLSGEEPSMDVLLNCQGRRNGRLCTWLLPNLCGLN